MKYSQITIAFWPKKVTSITIRKSGEYPSRYYKDITTSSLARINFLIDDFTLIYNPHKNFWVYEKFIE